VIQRGPSTAVARPRRRRSADEARRAILEAAEKRLVEQGPGAIKVQAIARDLGLTDPEGVDPVPDVLEGLVHGALIRTRRSRQDHRQAALQVEPEHRLE